MARFAEQDVRGLDVAVHDTLAVRVVERRGDIAQDAQAIVHLEGLLAGENGLERAAANQAHRVVGDRLAVANREDRNDVGMVELGGELCFTLEARVRFRRKHGIEREHLERHLTIERALLRAEDDPHAATPEQLHELEGVADRLLKASAELFRLLRGRGRVRRRARRRTTPRHTSRTR